MENPPALVEKACLVCGVQAVAWRPMDPRSSNPFKIRLKVPLLPESHGNNKTSPPLENLGGKKRKRADELYAVGLKSNAISFKVRPGSVEPAERDVLHNPQGSAHSLRTGDQRSKSSAAEEPIPKQNPKPRLVIKGSFGSSATKSEAISCISSASGIDRSYLLSKPHKVRKAHKEKKRKPHRPQEDLVNKGSRLPTPKLKIKLPFKVQSELPQPSANGILKHPSVTSNQPKKIEAEPAAITPAAKPPPAFKTESQAPSGVTVPSGEGTAGGISMAPRVGQLTLADGQEASSSRAPLFTVPGLGDVSRLLSRLQRKDAGQIFRHPVTDAVAPGYSDVIKRPMSFAQMQERLDNGEYTTWTAVQEDLETMFTNAMVFNSPATPYHQKAREMMGIARKLLQTLRTTGQFDARGRKPGVAHKPPLHSAPAAPLPERRTERRAAAVRNERPIKPKPDRKKVAAKKAAQRAAASGVLAPPTYDDYRGDAGPLTTEENTRATYLPLFGQVHEQQWKGLAKGSSANGVAFGSGRPTFRASYTGSLTITAYVRSLQAFGKTLTGFARAMLEKKIAAAQAVPPEQQPAVNALSTRPQLLPSHASLGTPGGNWKKDSAEAVQTNTRSGKQAYTSLAGGGGAASWSLLTQGRQLLQPSSTHTAGLSTVSAARSLPVSSAAAPWPPFSGSPPAQFPQASALAAAHQLRGVLVPKSGLGVAPSQPAPIISAQAAAARPQSQPQEPGVTARPNLSAPAPGSNAHSDSMRVGQQ